MNALSVFTPEKIHQAAEALRRLRPAYAPLLQFYEKIFAAQESAKSTIDLEPLTLSADLLAIKRSDGLPLTDMSAFRFDAVVGRDLMAAICRIIRTDNRNLADSAEALLRALETRAVDPSSLFERLLNGDDAYFEQTAQTNRIEKSALAFVVYNSLRPSLEICGEQLAAYRKSPENWQKGYCPICGNYPALAILDEEGRRQVVCSFCGHRWRISRVFCPFCETTDGSRLHYFYSEEEKDLRVDACDSCRKYLKTVDSRQAARTIYPPLEQVASLHLDINARRKGYESGIELVLEV
jgi:FdhE protein